MANRKRKPSLPPFESFEPKRWHEGGGSVVVTAQQVARGLLRITDREDINPTPLRVAAILLVRLEDMRTDVLNRVKQALPALSRGDEVRVRHELWAIQRDLATYYEGEFHGIRVTTDMAYHRSRLDA